MRKRVVPSIWENSNEEVAMKARRLRGAAGVA